MDRNVVFMKQMMYWKNAAIDREKTKRVKKIFTVLKLSVAMLIANGLEPRLLQYLLDKYMNRFIHHL